MSAVCGSHFSEATLPLWLRILKLLHSTNLEQNSTHQNVFPDVISTDVKNSNSETEHNNL